MKKLKDVEGNLIFKLHFSKAYDCIRWDFLELVFRKTGFGELWIGWMMEYVMIARAIVLFNGSSTSEFKFHRGLQQGDPLSPFLFILVTEVLHLVMVKAGELGFIKGIKKVIPVKKSHIYNLRMVQFCF